MVGNECQFTQKGRGRGDAKAASKRAETRGNGRLRRLHYGADFPSGFRLFRGGGTSIGGRPIGDTNRAEHPPITLPRTDAEVMLTRRFTTRPSGIRGQLRVRKSAVRPST